jgi:2-hydroxy-3-oxopropionate reductase
MVWLDERNEFVRISYERWFIGLGIMGAPMAGQLLAAGHKLFVNTRGSVPKEITDAGAKVCTTGAAVATNADVIIIMVPDTPDVEKVLFGRDGVSGGLPKARSSWT